MLSSYFACIGSLHAQPFTTFFTWQKKHSLVAAKFALTKHLSLCIFMSIEKHKAAVKIWSTWLKVLVYPLKCKSIVMGLPLSSGTPWKATADCLGSFQNKMLWVTENVTRRGIQQESLLHQIHLPSKWFPWTPSFGSSSLIAVGRMHSGNQLVEGSGHDTGNVPPFSSSAVTSISPKLLVSTKGNSEMVWKQNNCSWDNQSTTVTHADISWFWLKFL